MVQLIPLHLTTPSLASFKSRLVLPFWYWLTQVVLEKRPLNGCSVVVVVVVVVLCIFIVVNVQLAVACVLIATNFAADTEASHSLLKVDDIHVQEAADAGQFLLYFPQPRLTYDSDLKHAKISLRNIVSYLQTLYPTILQFCK